MLSSQISSKFNNEINGKPAPGDKAEPLRRSRGRALCQEASRNPIQGEADALAVYSRSKEVFGRVQRVLRNRKALSHEKKPEACRSERLPCESFRIFQVRPDSA